MLPLALAVDRMLDGCERHGLAVAAVGLGLDARRGVTFKRLNVQALSGMGQNNMLERQPEMSSDPLTHEAGSVDE